MVEVGSCRILTMLSRHMLQVDLMHPMATIPSACLPVVLVTAPSIQ